MINQNIYLLLYDLLVIEHLFLLIYYMFYEKLFQISLALYWELILVIILVKFKINSKTYRDVSKK